MVLSAEAVEDNPLSVEFDRETHLALRQHILQPLDLLEIQSPLQLSCPQLQ